MKEVEKEYDILTRKSSSLSDIPGAIHEVDLDF
jgi:hypothetical protein